MARRRGCKGGLVASTKKFFRGLFKAVPGKKTMKAAVRTVEAAARHPLKTAGKVGSSALKTAKTVARNPIKAAGKVGSSAIKTTRAATRRVRKLIKY